MRGNCVNARFSFRRRNNSLHKKGQSAAAVEPPPSENVTFLPCRPGKGAIFVCRFHFLEPKSTQGVFFGCLDAGTYSSHLAEYREVTTLLRSLAQRTKTATCCHPSHRQWAVRPLVRPISMSLDRAGAWRLCKGGKRYCATCQALKPFVSAYARMNYDDPE